MEKDATIMLNITGAGEQAFKREHETYSLEPAKVFPLNVTAEEVVEFVEGLFAQE